MRVRQKFAGVLAGAAVAALAGGTPAGATVVMSQFTWGSNPNVASPASANVVGFWQEILMAAINVYPCPPGTWGADGIFGSKTTAATRNFQGTLGVTVDGIVGPQTWNHAMTYTPPNHAPALINNGNGNYDYYTGGAGDAVLFYGSSSYGWKFEETIAQKEFNTDYAVNSIGSNFDLVVC